MTSYLPPKAVADVAFQALLWRREFGRGGTPVGVARARDLAHRRSLPLATIKRMASYFARHAVDKHAQGFLKFEPGFPSAGRIAWDLWGGDPARAWVREILKRARRD